MHLQSILFVFELIVAYSLTAPLTSHSHFIKRSLQMSHGSKNCMLLPSPPRYPQLCCFGQHFTTVLAQFCTLPRVQLIVESKRSLHPTPLAEGGRHLRSPAIIFSPFGRYCDGGAAGGPAATRAGIDGRPSLIAASSAEEERRRALIVLDGRVGWPQRQ